MGDERSCPLGSRFERRANVRFVFEELPATLHLLVRRVVKGVGVSFLLADEQMTLQRALGIVQAGDQFENGRVMVGHVVGPFFPEQRSRCRPVSVAAVHCRQRVLDCIAGSRQMESGG